ncbi:MAG: hypothetical protein E4G94_08335 [ANME-2 cluster archaeon]|nr:MAG: hypothetical protein E4G94_08335 [ANME-2 cluster archaeon]
MIVSNSGHLIQLARIDRLDLLETFFGGGLISRNEGLDALEKLARIMWLSVGVYEDVRKVVEGLD